MVIIRDVIQIMEINKAKLKEICQENNVAMLGVFGSFARGEASEHRDIDLLVRFSKRKGLLALIKLERELSDIFGRKVDLLTETAISPYIRQDIIDNLQGFYDSP